MTRVSGLVPARFPARFLRARGSYRARGVLCRLVSDVQQMSLMPPCGVSVCLLSRVPTVPLVHSYETTLPKYIQYIKRIENRQKERERESR